jgi:NAD-dependent deacetylase
MAPVEPATGALERARALVATARDVVVLTGAGISTDSGIPDFRGPDGVWTRDPEADKLSTIDHYLADAATRRLAWLRRLDNPAWVAEPNAGHHALVALERAGRLSLLITQNIDGLHVEAGSDPDRVVEVHGTVTEAMCVRCEWRGPMVDVLDRVRSGEADPPCEECGGILKSSTVFFGESLDAEDLDRSFAAVETCDLLLTVGTSLQVYPIAGVVPRAMAAGAGVVILNGEPTPYDDQADVVVRGSISEVLPALVGC